MPSLDEDKVRRRLDILQRKEAEASTRLLADKYRLRYIDLNTFPIDIDALALLSEDEARSAEMAIFQAAGQRLKIAMRNPEKTETKAALARLKDRSFAADLYLASSFSLERAWTFYRRVPEQKETTAGAIEISPQKLAEIQKQIHSLKDIEAQIAERLTARTSEALEVMLGGALATDASDVHIEPAEGGARVRLRLDGVLNDIITLPPKFYALLLSRIKLISELKLNIHDRSQDGRFSIKLDRSAVEVRTSVLPGPNGENVVLRVLNPRSIQISFTDLGMQPWVAETMRTEMKKPNGLILTTGPTGSGKTTTLYTFLGAIHTPEIKIITIEDPIEYHLAGIEQTQVDPEKGYDFANGLRAIVRQDPDVILVGEIRDRDTAETAMHAALTGHLVFSTLHTNDAAGTIPRLIDLGVKPAIIAPAINAAMAQRLVRRLCPQCRTPVAADDKAAEIIKKEIAQFPKGVQVPDESRWMLFAPAEKGCVQCSNIGYKGRVGVYEILLIDVRVEKLVLAGAPESELKKEAARQGQITMRQDGILKVIAGVTDLAELERVVGV